MSGMKLTNEEATRFIFAGKAVFTLRSVETGNRFTYKMNAAKGDDGKFKPDFHFAKMNVAGSFDYAGCVRDRKTFFQTKKSKVPANHQGLAALEYVLRHLADDSLDGRVEVWHEGRCGKCGKPLTVPESIRSGIGPECAKTIRRAVYAEREVHQDIDEGNEHGKLEADQEALAFMEGIR